MAKLTVAKLEKLKAPKKNEPPYDVWDGGSGFGVRVSGKPGAPVRSFQVMKRINGKQVRRVIGGYKELVSDGKGGFAEFSLAMARKKASEWIAMMKEGLDPAEEADKARKAKANAHEARIKNSFKAALETYLKRKAKLRSIHATERELRRECKDWMSRPLADISQHDVKDTIQAIVDRGTATQAHTVFAMLRGFFNWVCDSGNYGIELSPCAKIKPVVLIGPRNIRNRVLKDFELAAYWRAADATAYPFGPFFRLLLLTALRRNEAADARWSEIDMGAKLWTVPAARMKNGAAFAVPLVPDIITLLQNLPRLQGGDYVFSTTHGQRPISGFSNAKHHLDALMKADLEAQGEQFVPFVIHDTRRTVRTKLSALPVEQHVRELIVAHAQPGLHKVYDLYAYEEEKRDGLMLWHAKLRSIVEPKGVVIPFNRL